MNTNRLESVVSSVKNWYIPALAGIVLILVGIYVFTIPATSYLVLSTLFSISFFVSGILQISFSISNRKEINSWGWHLVGGILYTLFGLFMISNPEISIATLPYVVGFYLLFQSASAIGWSIDLNTLGFQGWGWVTFLGILGVIGSFILLANPVYAGLSLVIWTGMTFILTGLAGIMFSVGLKRIKNAAEEISDNAKKRINIGDRGDDQLRKAS